MACSAIVGSTCASATASIATGAVIGKCYQRHRATEFLDFLKEIDRRVSAGLDVHIVMDNYATHETPKIKAWLARRPHWHVHFGVDDAAWDHSVFSKNRDRLLEGDIAAKFLNA
ncbi:hypothetical protein J2X13_005762, partial [Aminobacter aminovorans]|nr:hypothetical protein [Aminobacter aminovorans]